MSDGHVHDCTGPDLRCPCGFVFRVPPVCVSVEVSDGPRTVVTEGFNCETIEGAICFLESAIRRLRAYKP